MRNTQFLLLLFMLNNMENFNKAIEKLSDRVMNETDKDKLNLYSTALTDITNNVQRYCDWIMKNV